MTFVNFFFFFRKNRIIQKYFLASILGNGSMNYLEYEFAKVTQASKFRLYVV